MKGCDAWEELEQRLKRVMPVKAALTLLEWDNETLAPEEAGSLTAKIQGGLAESYHQMMTDEALKEALKRCEACAGAAETGLAGAEVSGDETGGSTADGLDQEEVRRAILREAREEYDRLSRIPREEYRAYQELTAKSARVWARAKESRDFSLFAPVLKEVLDYQKRFAGYQAKPGQKLYDVMLDEYEKGFGMKELDEFFRMLKEELVPFLKQVQESPVRINDEFLTGDYPEDQQRELAEYLAGYVGFDFRRGVLAESAHPFTTALHNRDVRLTTHYSEKVDSSLFSVIHEAGHGIYEQGIDDSLTQTLAGEGASMAMHESQSRFFENVIGRNESFWVPVYGRLKEWFPEQLKGVGRDVFVRAVSRVQPGLIRTEADELSYSLHILVRYELEKQLVEEDLDVEELPGLWAEKYQEYLGVRPEHDGEGVLQDIHWSQGSFGYFPSYALGSAFAAQMYAHMKKVMDVDGLLEAGQIEPVREYLREHVHRFGKVRTSRQILRDMTGEDFNPRYYVDYLKEKYGKLYQIQS